MDALGQCLGGTCYRHTSVGYDRARKIMFGELDDVIDDITTVYYNDKYQPCYIRNDTDYSDNDWYVDILNYNGNILSYDEYLLWLKENQANIINGHKLPHWSIVP